MVKRLLVQMVYDASTNNYPQYFPYPMLLLNIKKPEDELVDLNLALNGERELVKLQAIQKFIESVDPKKYSEIIVNMGEFPPDADKTKYFDFWMDHSKFNYKIMGVYPTIAKERITKKFLGNTFYQITPTNFNLDDVLIPTEMIQNYPKVKDKLKANMKISSGCPRSCKMCPVVPIYDKSFKTFDLDAIMARIHHYHSIGVRYITFTDDNMTANKKFFIEFLDRILEAKANKKLKGMKFLCAEGFEVLSFVDEEICKRVMPAGFYDIKIGMENINEDFLKKIGKYYTKRETIDKAIENIEKYKIDARLLLLIGMDESEENILENLRYISKHKLPVRANILRPYEGVEIYKTPFTRKVNEERAEYYKALSYAISWLGAEQGIDLFEPDSLDQLLKKLNFKHTMEGENHIFEGKINMGYIGTGRCIKSIQYMLRTKYNREFMVTFQDAKSMIIVPKKEKKEQKSLF